MADHPARTEAGAMCAARCAKDLRGGPIRLGSCAMLRPVPLCSLCVLLPECLDFQHFLGRPREDHFGGKQQVQTCPLTK